FASPQERHRPPHRTDRGLATFFTASTEGRVRHLASPDRRDGFSDLLATTSVEYEVEILAWVVLAEHYHLVVAPRETEVIAKWLARLHRRSSTRLNQDEGTSGRQCWYQYWDRTLWTEGDLLSRVNYIHANPVKHGYVTDPSEWRWSSLSQWQDADESSELATRMLRFPPPRRVPNDDF
ncbi:MAG: hypothetical protein K0Q72_3399, partial [Armatimonadetes bacterium]|nr:hypothetical protein [Armatimonadota bacterium]